MKNILYWFYFQPEYFLFFLNTNTASNFIEHLDEIALNPVKYKM